MKFAPFTSPWQYIWTCTFCDVSKWRMMTSLMRVFNSRPWIMRQLSLCPANRWSGRHGIMCRNNVLGNVSNNVLGMAIREIMCWTAMWDNYVTRNVRNNVLGLVRQSSVAKQTTSSSSIPVFQYSIIPVFQYASILVFQYSRILVFHIPVFRYSNIPVRHVTSALCKRTIEKRTMKMFPLT